MVTAPRIVRRAPAGTPGRRPQNKNCNESASAGKGRKKSLICPGPSPEQPKGENNQHQPADQFRNGRQRPAKPFQIQAALEDGGGDNDGNNQQRGQKEVQAGQNKVKYGQQVKVAGVPVNLSHPP